MRISMWLSTIVQALALVPALRFRSATKADAQSLQRVIALVRAIKRLNIYQLLPETLLVCYNNVYTKSIINLIYLINNLMPSNKDFSYRIEILDNCLRRTQKKWSFNELYETVNQKLTEEYKKTVSKRTLQYDIDYLLNEKLAPIEKTRISNTIIYSYSDANYSIKNLLIKDEELLYLKDAIEILKQVTDFQIVEDVEEIVSKLENTIKTNISEKRHLISFEKHTTAGKIHIDNIFTAIKEKITLLIIYKPFNVDEPFEWIVHPYLLKEFRSRWFLLCRVGNENFVTNIALDRIIKIKNAKEIFIENNLFKPEDYFNNIIGVSIPREENIQTIEIKVNKMQAPYVITKPIHSSQTILKKFKNGSMIISLRLIINYELKSVLLSYGSAIEVIAPLKLRQELKEELAKTVTNYD